MSMAMEKNDHNPREPFMAFVEDDITARSLNDIAGQQGWNANRIFAGGVDLALETLRDIATPQLLVIDLSRADDPMKRIEELAGVCDAGVRLLCLGTLNDVSLYRDLLDMGVEDYLLKPIDPDALHHAVERASRIEEVQPRSEPDCEGELVSVIGALGGVGASTVALNLAWELSQNRSARVALVDLDLHFGTIALSLDLEPGKGFREALENPSRIDSLFLERAMVKVNDRLSILSCETDLAYMCRFDNEALELLVERLRQQFDYVVLDVPRSLFAQVGDFLAKSGRMTIVSDLSLNGMRDSLRMVRFAKDFTVGEKLALVANRVGENKERQLAEKEFEKGVDFTLKCLIPYEPKAFAQAELQGGTILKVVAKCKAAQAMEPLFADFGIAGEKKQKAPSFWQRMFNRK